MEWISIEENPPLDGMFAVVYAPRSFPKNYRGVIGRFYDDVMLFYDEATDRPIEDGTHYIPLPDAPKNM